jgi:hypothetical protein
MNGGGATVPQQEPFGTTNHEGLSREDGRSLRLESKRPLEAVLMLLRRRPAMSISQS